MAVYAWLIVPVLAVALFGVHRLALWMEGRGWIHYRHRGSAAIGGAMLEIQSFYRPSVEHVIELREDESSEQDYAGDPPEPGPAH
ncbi:MAG TPA: hypothetical protein VK886_14795 [Vicinamibacterales bacterium]|nr:hypothetical protein [Vicinamibacterales bacterium]